MTKKIFDWQTDDEGDWQDEPVVQKKKISSHRRRSVYWGLLIALLAISIGGIVAYSQLNRRVKQATTTVANDVIHTHQLLMQAAIEQDRELFSSVIQQENSTAFQVNRTFNRNQEILLMRGLFLDRSPLGLWFDYEAAELLDWAEVSQVTLSPDLTAAELRVDLPYLYQNEAGELQSVTLRQTAVYQKNVNGRWQLTPPSEAFWGAYQTDEQPRLKLVFPARDAEIGRRLAADISPLLVQLCNSDEITCPDDLVIELYLSRNIEKLAELDRDYQWDNSSLSSLIEHTILLYFPAPSLVGMPADDDGYSALQRGYASLLAATMIRQFGAASGNGLSDQMVIQQQLAAYQLALPSSLNTHPQQILEQPPIPFPNQDIILMCRNQLSNELYQYQIAKNQWQTIPLLGGGVSGMSALANGDGALVTLENLNAAGGSQLVWLQGEQARILVEDDGFLTAFSSFILPQFDEADPLQHVIRYRAKTLNGFEPRIGLLDEANCTDGACGLTPLDQAPIFSPNGRFQLLYTIRSQLSLADADGELIETLGDAGSPRWIDDRTFAFIEPIISSGGLGFESVALITAVIAPNGTLSQTRITVDDLLPVLPNDAKIETLIIFENSSIGEGEQLIYLYSINQQHSLRYILQMNAQFEPTKLIEDFTNGETIMMLETSPNGRFISMIVNDSGETTFRLYDIEQERWQAFPMQSNRFSISAWSTDGNWLLLLEKDALRFILPGYDYDRRVFHDFQDCETAVWVNQP